MKLKSILFTVIAFFLLTSGIVFLIGFIKQQPVQYKAVASLEKVHIVYLNFDNPVTVVVPGIPKEKVVVRSPEVEIKSLGDSRYSIPVKDPLLTNKNIHLNIFTLNTAGKEQLLQIIEYKVIGMPEPQPFFAGFNGGKVTAADMNLSDSLYVEIPGFYYEGFRFTVSRFLMIRTDTTGFSSTMPQEAGCMLSPNQKLIMGSLTKGDKIVFSDIFATYVDPITKIGGNEIRIPKNMEFEIR